MGDPNATATPAAAVAVRNSLALSALFRYLVINLAIEFPTQTA